jgi:hypothetical protein
VITFENPDETGQVREVLKKIEHGGYLTLDSDDEEQLKKILSKRQ